MGGMHGWHEPIRLGARDDSEGARVRWSGGNVKNFSPFFLKTSLKWWLPKKGGEIQTHVANYNLG